MDVYEVTKKLIGPIEPVGETQTDAKRYENLKDMIDLTESLIAEIGDVARFNKDRHEHSMSQAGKRAHKFFADQGIDDY